MAAERPDLHEPRTRPPRERAAGPDGPPLVLFFSALFLLAVGVACLFGMGGAAGPWVALGVGLLLLVLGVLGLSRYVQRIAWTGSSRTHLRRGLSGMNVDMTVTDDAHEDISPEDLPPDSPTHHELERRIMEEERRLTPGRRPRAPTYRP